MLPAARGCEPEAARQANTSSVMTLRRKMAPDLVFSDCSRTFIMEPGRLGQLPSRSSEGLITMATCGTKKELELGNLTFGGDLTFV